MGAKGKTGLGAQNCYALAADSTLHTKKFIFSRPQINRKRRSTNKKPK
jgi:hypothetical protein